MFVTTSANEKLRLSGEDAMFLGQPKPANGDIIAYGAIDRKARFWNQTTLLTSLFAAPPPIGATTPSTGAFTTLSATAPIIHKNYVVSTLPAAGSNTYGIAFVTDATLTAITGLGLAPTGGGGNTVPVYSDGAGWKII